MPNISPLKKAILVCLGLLASSFVAHAANATWNGTTSTSWATVGNWSASPVPGLTDTATFNNPGNGNKLISLGTGVQINNIIFDTANATAYTIGAGAVGSQTLTMNGTGVFNVTYRDQHPNVQRRLHAEHRRPERARWDSRIAARLRAKV